MPPLLLDLAIIRLIEPASKLRSLELPSRYFEIKYSQRIYRTIPKLISWKADIEQRACSVARQQFKEQFYYVLYDVTTLYFESFKPDEFKIQGFSKDNKSQQPQIVIGLLVTHAVFLWRTMSLQAIPLREKPCYLWLKTLLPNIPTLSPS